MTGRTTRQHLRGLNVIFRHQQTTFRDFFLSLILLPPFHIENLFFRSHKFLGISMAAKTPLHLQRRGLISDRHLIHPAMTRRTAHTLVHMNAVIEISVVRKVVHSDPFDRFAAAKAGTNRLEIRALRPNLFMTIHAGVGWRHPSRGSNFHRRMAVAAINAIVAHVVLMTKLDGLLAFNPLPRVPGGTIQLRGHPQRCDKDKNGAINRQLREGVRAVMKNLWHRRSFANPSLQNSAIQELGHLAQSKNREQRLHLKRQTTTTRIVSAVPQIRLDQNYFLLSVRVL
jgi:hypothetical protein